MRCPIRTSSAWRSRSSDAPSSGRVASRRARPARRGDDRRTRWRDERPARLRRRMLYHTRRLRQPRRPASSRGMVCGRRRVHGAASLHPRPVVVSRDLRRGSSSARETGSAPTTFSPKPSNGRPTAASREDGRCRSPCSPGFDCGRAGWRTPRRSWTGSTTSPLPSGPSSSCRSSAATPRTRKRCSTGGRTSTKVSSSSSAGRSRSQPATSTRRRRPQRGCTTSPRRQVELTSPPRQLSSTGARPPVDGDLAAATDALEDAVVRFSTLAVPARGRPGAPGSRARPGDRRLSPRSLDGAYRARLPSRSSAPARDADRATAPAARARCRRVARRPRGERDELTAREREVLGLVRRGAVERRDRRPARDRPEDRRAPRRARAREARRAQPHRGGRARRAPGPRR